MADEFRRLAINVPTDFMFGESIASAARAGGIALGYRRNWLTQSRSVNALLDELRVRQGELAGVVTMVLNEDHAAQWQHPEIPVVNVSSRGAIRKLPSVLVDNSAVGRLAAEHLLAQGHRQLRFFNAWSRVTPHLFYGERRWQGFRLAAAEAGVQAELTTLRRIRSMLHRSPTPIGVLASNDLEAIRLCERLIEAGINVPEQVAVVGVDNDEALCESAAVPITSVDTAGREVGRAAVELLHRLIEGEPPPREPLLIPPAGIAVRQSTQAVAVDDEHVRRAAQLIRQHACDGLRLEAIIDELPIARRTLELRFRRALGRSPHAEIVRIRLERAKELLAATDLTVGEVAQRSGFSNLARFYARFKRDAGVTPGVYRQRAQR